MRRAIEPRMVEIEPRRARTGAGTASPALAPGTDRPGASGAAGAPGRASARGSASAQESLIGGEDRRHVGRADAALVAVHQRVVRRQAERRRQRRGLLAHQVHHLGQAARDQREIGVARAPRARPSRRRSWRAPAPPPDRPAPRWHACRRGASGADWPRATDRSPPAPRPRPDRRRPPARSAVHAPGRPAPPVGRRAPPPPPAASSPRRPSPAWPPPPDRGDAREAVGQAVIGGGHARGTFPGLAGRRSITSTQRQAIPGDARIADDCSAAAANAGPGSGTSPAAARPQRHQHERRDVRQAERRADRLRVEREELPRRRIVGARRTMPGRPPGGHTRRSPSRPMAAPVGRARPGGTQPRSTSIGGAPARSSGTISWPPSTGPRAHHAPPPRRAPRGPAAAARAPPLFRTVRDAAAAERPAPARPRRSAAIRPPSRPAAAPARCPARAAPPAWPAWSAPAPRGAGRRGHNPISDARWRNCSATSSALAGRITRIASGRVSSGHSTACTHSGGSNGNSTQKARPTMTRRGPG